MASQSMSLAYVLIPYFSVLGNRYLFSGGLEPYIPLTIGHEADKAPLQAPYRKKFSPGHPDLPLLFCCPSLVSLPGHYLTPLCPHHLVSQAHKTLFPQNTHLALISHALTSAQSSLCCLPAWETLTFDSQAQVPPSI